LKFKLNKMGVNVGGRPDPDKPRSLAASDL